MNSLSLRHSAWFGDREVVIDFPDDWPVTVHAPRDLPPLAESSIKDKLAAFVRGLERERIGPRSKVAVIVDDISRPTDVPAILPVLLRELETIGVVRENLYVITAGGTHDRMTEDLLAVKVGEEVLRSYQVQAHDPHGALLSCGRTSNGIPIWINRLVKECVLKIGVGGVFPHSPAGFSGGAKIVLGVSGFKTIARLHYRIRGTELGGEVRNDFRDELVEISRRIGLNASVCVVMNGKREIAEIFAGDIVSAHEEASTYYAGFYALPESCEADIVVSNTYPFDVGLVYSKKGWWPVAACEPGTTGIIVGSYPIGLAQHGLHPMTRNTREFLINKLLVMSKLPARDLARMFVGRFSRIGKKRGDPDAPPVEKIFFRPEARRSIDPAYGVTFERSWSDVLKRLKRKYAGKCPKVVVYPCAPLQYPGRSSASTDSFQP